MLRCVSISTQDTVVLAVLDKALLVKLSSLLLQEDYFICPFYSPASY